MNRINQGLDILHRRLGQNTVAQIEDITGAVFYSLQNIVGLSNHLFLRTEERIGIEIPLKAFSR